jgi:hypothetical protein
MKRRSRPSKSVLVNTSRFALPGWTANIGSKARAVRAAISVSHGEAHVNPFASRVKGPEIVTSG